MHDYASLCGIFHPKAFTVSQATLAPGLPPAKSGPGKSLLYTDTPFMLRVYALRHYYYNLLILTYNSVVNS